VLAVDALVPLCPAVGMITPAPLLDMS